MSHKATNWAVQQRGISSAAKIVLWHLADRHHPDNGCFPSQERLSEDCEISRSSLNNQLAALEAAGLIVRQKRLNATTKRQKSTRYILGFEDDFAQHHETRVQKLDTEAVSKKQPDPCPKNGQSRVQDLDTNLVKEPVREPVSDDTHKTDFHEFMKASLRGGDEAEAGDAFFALIGDGVDPKQIIAAMRAYSEEQKDNDRSYVRFAENFLKKGFWKKYVSSGKPAPASKEQQMKFWAEKINGNGFVAASSIKPTLARELVAAKLVTPEQLKARGIAA